MRVKNFRIFVVLIVIGAILIGCTTSVSRMRPKRKTDLSGRWNDTDARLVAETMIRGMLSSNWIRKYRLSEGQKPVIIVGEIENLTSEHIETGTFLKDIERELVNSGKVSFVASAGEREGIRDERQDQQSNASRRTRAELLEETGADVMLIGGLKSHLDTEGRRQVRFYQVDLELIEIETNEKLWIDTHKIKKYVQKALIKP